MKIVVIDGQGGKLGALIVENLVNKGLQNEITAIGTNTLATAAMLKAGALKGATGENPVIVACRDADVITGPMGIAFADSLLGEITPKMATAIGESKAVKYLIPINQCNNRVVGVAPMSMSDMAKEAANQIENFEMCK